MISPKLQRHIRNAVTLVEVIFAIGVILIGLLGLLSILPLAGKRSQDSVSLSTGPQLANRILAELKSNQFYSNRRLLRFEDTEDVPNPSAFDLLRPRKRASENAVRAFCIDPLYVSNSLSQSQPHTLVTPNGGVLIPAAKRNTATRYDGSNFPLYHANHNPRINPSSKLRDADDTPLRIPMQRVGILSSEYGNWLPEMVARTLAENRDDLINSPPDDKSLPVRLSAGEIQVIEDPDKEDPEERNKSKYLRTRNPSGEFSWMVTVSPMSNGYANVAVVVLRNRSYEVSFPESVESPQENLSGERIAAVSFYPKDRTKSDGWVSPQGFIGGAGGVLNVDASAATDSKLIPGDWVMLSRGGGLAGDTTSDHHWYRVVNLDGDAESLNVMEDGAAPADQTDLTLTVPVWRRRVLLDGPDRNFDVDNNGVPDPTFVTIIPGVVCVTETILKLSEI